MMMMRRRRRIMMIMMKRRIMMMITLTEYCATGRDKSSLKRYSDCSLLEAFSRRSELYEPDLTNNKH